MSYGCSVWGYSAKTNVNILEVAQNTEDSLFRSDSSLLNSSRCQDPCLEAPPTGLLPLVQSQCFTSQRENTMIVDAEKILLPEVLKTQMPEQIPADSCIQLCRSIHQSHYPPLCCIVKENQSNGHRADSPWCSKRRSTVRSDTGQCLLTCSFLD
ncbi:hypothetical protein TNCV_1919571 [Trichonephila clavipes]|nr:hypothetical protein TNCV_1919571 [Trichonephila clavipes]